MHTYLLIILFFMTFGHLKLVRQHKCNYQLGLLSPPNRPFLLHRPFRVSHRPLWEPLVYCNMAGVHLFEFFLGEESGLC